MTAVLSKTEKRQTWLCAGICLAGALCAVLLQIGMNARMGDPGTDPDLLYFGSPSAVKKMALGYDNLMADIYWIRTIQYFGRKEEAAKRPVRYKNLPALLDITTTLDPDMIDAYRIGSIFIAEPDPVGAGKPEAAISLLDKGIEVHPDLWRFHYEKGVAQYTYLNDYKAAGETWLETSRIAGAPEWMARLAAAAFTKGGSIRIARDIWWRQYNEATRKDVKENALNHLLSFQVAEDLWTLEVFLGVYRLEHGVFPGSLAALAASESRTFNIVDPLGTPYAYDPETGTVRLSPQTKVHYLEVPESYKEDFQMSLTESR